MEYRALIAENVGCGIIVNVPVNANCATDDGTDGDANRVVDGAQTNREARRVIERNKMNISETIKALPPGAITVLVGGNTKGSIGSKLELTVAGLQRLIDALEKCETAIDSLSTGDLGFGSNDKTWWALRDELLSEIREALGK